MSLLNRNQNPERMIPSVAITGIGMITPIGINTEQCWNGFRRGQSGIRIITKFDAGKCRTRIGGQLPDEVEQVENRKIPKRLQKQTTRMTRLALICADQAIQDSLIDPSVIDFSRAGVIIGASGACVSSLGDPALKGAERYTIIREMINSIPARISIENGFQGPSYAISASSESSACAISSAFDLIRAGTADIVLAGGVDSLLTQSYTDYFNGLNLLTTENDNPDTAVKPFDRRRNGFVLSDGACVIVLENLTHARRRGARIYALMAGYASSWIGSASPASMAESMASAIQSSGLSTREIGYVNANGTATIDNDQFETTAIRQLFGSAASDLCISSLKSMIGHTMGASTAIAFAATAIMMHVGEIIPTMNLEYPDPACDLNYVPNRSQHWTKRKSAICNSFGHKGHHYTLALTHPDKGNDAE
jgi:3-oxoacyl-[acyl-carrier-protein] synthase II